MTQDAVALVEGLDGEAIEYTRCDGSLIGPCPMCYMRLRLTMDEASARRNAVQLRIADAAHYQGDLPTKRDGSFKRFVRDYQALHAGCFEGCLIYTPTGLAWHKAPAYKDLGLYWSR